MKKQRGAAPKRRKKIIHLTVFDRTRIELRRNAGWTLRAIAKEIKKDVSTVSREIRRHKSKTCGYYRAEAAHKRALAKEEAHGVRPLLKNQQIREYVLMKLKEWWSPEQISIRLPLDHKGLSISPEAIYQYVYARVNKGGSLKKGCVDLRPYLARRHSRRQSKGFRQARRLHAPRLPSIEDRPKVVEKRKEVGHWEDDTIVSRQSTVRLKTMNERVSGIILIRKMQDGTVAESNRTVRSCMEQIPKKWRKTLTRDRGTENFGYLEIEKELHMTCFFAHAYCSQERGSNENGNGLIRRPYPKKTDFDYVPDVDIAHLEHMLNSRPRKRLGGKTPYEVFFELTGVALSH